MSKKKVKTFQDRIGTDCDCACLSDFAPFTYDLFPRFYSLELTFACNNKCEFCGNSLHECELLNRRKISKPLTGEQWKFVIKKISSFAHRIKLTGGEPTLHPDFLEIVRTIQQLKVRFSIFTNGRWSNPEYLVRALKKNEMCGGLLVSLHSNIPEVHDELTGVKGSFKETISNIRMAADNGIQIHTSTVINKINFDQIEAIVELSKKSGALISVFNRYLGSSSWVHAPSKDQIAYSVKVVEDLKKKNQPAKLGNPIPQLLAKNSSMPCSAGYLSCTIDPLGNVRACNHSHMIVGNLLQTHIQEIWGSSTLNAWRASKERGAQIEKNSCNYLVHDLGYKYDVEV